MRLRIPEQYAKILDLNQMGYSGRELIELLCSQIPAEGFRQLFSDPEFRKSGAFFGPPMDPRVYKISADVTTVEVDFPESSEELLKVFAEQLGVTQAEAACYLLSTVGKTVSGAIDAQAAVASQQIPVSLSELSELTGIPESDIPQDFEGTKSNRKRKRSIRKKP